MYTSSMVVCCYTQGKVLRLPGDDSSHKENPSRYAYTPDTTCDIYASNNDIFLSTSLFLDWRLAKDSPRLEGLARGRAH